jgi:hypothetical protein
MIDERSVFRSTIAAIGAAAVLALWWAIAQAWKWLAG